MNRAKEYTSYSYSFLTFTVSFFVPIQYRVQFRLIDKIDIFKVGQVRLFRLRQYRLSGIIFVMIGSTSIISTPNELG